MRQDTGEEPSAQKARASLEHSRINKEARRSLRRKVQAAQARRWQDQVAGHPSGLLREVKSPWEVVNLGGSAMPEGVRCLRSDRSARPAVLTSLSRAGEESRRTVGPL